MDWKIPVTQALRIHREFINNEISYLDAIEELQKLEMSPKTAEKFVELWEKEKGTKDAIRR